MICDVLVDVLLNVLICLWKLLTYQLISYNKIMTVIMDILLQCLLSQIISKFEGLLPTSSTYHQQIEMDSAEDLGKLNKTIIIKNAFMIIKY